MPARDASLVVADVGARGGPHERWRRTGATVLAFDPDAPPDETETVIALPYALGRTRERLTFHRTRYPAASGLFPLTPLFSRFDAASDVEIVGAEEIEVVDFDSIAAELGLPRPDVFTIDVQGAELQVLEGASAHLETALAVEVEVWFEPPHPAVPPFSELDLFLRERGFHLYDVTTQRYARRGHGVPALELDGGVGQSTTGQVVWGDALYLRDPVGDGADLDAPTRSKLETIMRAYGLDDCADELVAAASAG